MQINISPSRTILTATGTIATSGDNTIISAPGAGIRICLTGIFFQQESTTATTILLKDGSTVKKRFFGVLQGDGIPPIVYPQGIELKLTVNTALVLNISSANTVGYSFEYYLEYR
jgi:hypothetical protein